MDEYVTICTPRRPDGYTRLSKKKYTRMKDTLIAILSESAQPLNHKQITQIAEEHCRKDNNVDIIFPNSGSNSLSWLAETVRRDLEFRKIIQRTIVKRRLHFSLTNTNSTD